MPGYTSLKVWYRARLLSKLVYDLTDMFPRREKSNFIDQMRRAAQSIISNIAEGSRRRHKKEKFQYYSYAFASAAELEAQLMVTRDLELAPEQYFDQAQDVADHVARLMNRLAGRFADPTSD